VHAGSPAFDRFQICDSIVAEAPPVFDGMADQTDQPSPEQQEKYMTAVPSSTNALTRPIIDLSSDPYVPMGSKVEENQKTLNGSSFLEWDPHKISLYIDPSQERRRKRYNCIQGHKLRERLAGKPVLNANVLDYLLDNPHLIPDYWKMAWTRGNCRIFFWGTLYGRGGELCVRYLNWDFTDGWDWYPYRLYDSLSDNSPAALFVS
jgi:hypothetical protein